MVASLNQVRTLLVAIFVLMAGSGFLSTLIAVRLEEAGRSALLIGLVATAYFGGLTLGALKVAPLIARVGHIRAFAAFVSIFSASSLSYAIFDNPLVWTLLRFADGFMMSGVFVCLESWLNRVARPDNRSVILAAYMIALYAGQAIGQFLLNLGDNAPALPFMASAVLLSLSVLPVVLTRIQQPMMEGVAPFSLKRLYAASPLGIVGTVATGVMLGAFYALGAVFVQRVGMPLAQVALFTSCTIAGGVALQYPLGRLSDRFDRRLVIVICTVVTALLCAALALVRAPVLIFLAGALFGGFAFALYPLCVAHSNDHLEDSERVGASSGLVLVYSIGAMAGPMVGSVAMASFGPAGLFAAIGAVAVAASLFGLWRIAVSPPVPEAEQQDFQSMPRTTPMVAVLEDDSENWSESPS
ncbi:MFS transporter [Aurantiacibacter poecillastricola]|uniref:MFS transporter n=1 Tax=Aurantiacibacter poecillastricola TaxID=3064385 RepID=UPI00273E5B1B|nr:MFS transporter [Aurantiacibacter sp. 219JJ12-13]MDP5261206.1 MFS transporter [Aurantiacibacter sp. 219JJ12-13]